VQRFDDLGAPSSVKPPVGSAIAHPELDDDRIDGRRSACAGEAEPSATTRSISNQSDADVQRSMRGAKRTHESNALVR
jgi:hypothetical protein